MKCSVFWPPPTPALLAPPTRRLTHIHTAACLPTAQAFDTAMPSYPPPDPLGAQILTPNDDGASTLLKAQLCAQLEPLIGTAAAETADEANAACSVEQGQSIVANLQDDAP